MPGIINGAMNSAITIRGDFGKPVTLTDSDLERLDHASISRLRHYNEDNAEVDKRLAPFEHQAFAREWTRELPYIAAPSLAVATPLYSAAKALGVDVGIRDVAKFLGLLDDDGKQRDATPPSLEQIKRGYKGIAQGLGIVD